jgi:formamidopyrimidine-DNA glycosylase
MPELPEIETIKRGLENLAGEKIVKIFRSDKKLRINSCLDLQQLKGRVIKEFSRRARYLIINFIDIVISDLSRYLKIAERSPNIKNKDVDL